MSEMFINEILPTANDRWKSIIQDYLTMIGQVFNQCLR